MRDPFASSDEDEIPTAEALFHEVLSLPRDAWAAHLERACPPDRQPALHAEVMALLQGHEQAGGFLPFESDATRLFRRPAAPLPEKPGDLIGPYKLKEQIGEGGFGVVWVADQEQPVRRRVALKILKPGMDTKQVMARFEQERQALAMMDHPNIARVLDAGATPLGRPFFVMELVKGVKITQYCDQAHLPTRDRLRLFITVCQAVQHAHQKGVIHRDLKPSNILVTLHDGVPVPKVIDFGVAKATRQQHLTDLTIYTQFEQMLGTPLYMSPEQAELSGLDIDTRSDIYSLGVLLYELLTGRTPFDPESLMKRGLEEIRRAVREQEPQKPSTFISTLALDRRTDLARQRQTDSARLLGQIRGDLDWIVMKALEKDRSRRYETATGLAQDIQRHLESEPVQARPPTMGYRFRRFARRHKTTFAAAATVLAALVTGLATTTWMFFKEKDARERAVAAEAEQGRLRQLAVDAERAQTKQREKAEAAAARSDQITLFLTDMLKGVGPSVAMGRDTTMLREILDKTAERLGTDLKDQPEIEGFLRFHLGNVYSELGDDTKAEAMLRQAVEKAKSLGGVEHADSFLAIALPMFAVSLAEQGKLSEAEATVREALAIIRNLPGPEHPDVAIMLSNLSIALSSLQQLPEAEMILREALALYRKGNATNSPGLAASLSQLANLLEQKGQPLEAEQLAREALAMKRSLFGNEHPVVATALINLANSLLSQKRLPEAEPIFREGLTIQRTVLGHEHPHLALSLNQLATVLYSQGNYAEAEPLFRESLAIQRKGGGIKKVELNRSQTLHNLALCLNAQGKPAEAEPLFREALAIRRKELGQEHPDVAESLHQLAHSLEKQGDPESAESTHLQSLDLIRKIGGPESLKLANHAACLAKMLITAKKHAAAEPFARESLAIREKKMPDDWRTFSSRSLLGASLLGQQRFDEAEPLLVSGYEGMQQRADTIPQAGRSNVKQSLERVVQFYEATQDHAQATVWQRKLEALGKAAAPPGSGTKEDPQ